jgi:hypothetical protein
MEFHMKKRKEILQVLAETYNGSDRWYLECIASAVEGNDEDFYKLSVPFIMLKIRNLTSGVKHLRPLPGDYILCRSLNNLKIRAGDARVSEQERSKALTALSFINTKEAVLAMIELSKSSLQDVKEQASYWVAFRQSNDWFALFDWNKSGIDTEHQRQLASMKVKMGKIMDEHLPFDEKKWSAQDMAKDPIGGQMLITMASENKLPQDLYPVVEEVIFKNPDAGVRIQASNVFRSATGTSYSINTVTG